MATGDIISGIGLGNHNILSDPLIATIVLGIIISIIIIYYATRKKEKGEKYITIQPRIIKVQQPIELELERMPESLQKHAEMKLGMTRRITAIPSVVLQGNREDLTALYIDFKNVEQEVMGRKEAYTVTMRIIDNIIEKYHGIRSQQENKDVLVLFRTKVEEMEPEMAAIRASIEIDDATKRNLIKTSFGIHTGTAIMKMGADEKLRYTPLESTTQIAARIAKRANGNEVVISQDTYTPISAQIQVEKIQSLEVGPKHMPLYIVKTLTKREKFKPYVDNMMRRWKKEDTDKARAKTWGEMKSSTASQLSSEKQSTQGYI